MHSLSAAAALPVRSLLAAAALSLGKEPASWVLRSSEDSYSKVHAICRTEAEINSHLDVALEKSASIFAQRYVMPGGRGCGECGGGRYVEETVQWEGHQMDLRCLVLIDTQLDAWLCQDCLVVVSLPAGGALCLVFCC